MNISTRKVQRNVQSNFGSKQIVEDQNHEDNDLEVAISNLTHRENNTKKLNSSAFVGLLGRPLRWCNIDVPVFKRKFRILMKLKSLEKLAPAHNKIRPSVTITSTLREVKEHLEHCLHNDAFEDEEIWKDFKITPAGNIFKNASKSYPSTEVNGQGVLITKFNEVIEASFLNETVQTGRMSMLYSNGEYYEGAVLYKGIKNGQGTYYYANGDVYT